MATTLMGNQRKFLERLEEMGADQIRENLASGNYKGRKKEIAEQFLETKTLEVREAAREREQTETLYDRWFTTLRNNRLTASILILGVIAAAVLAVTALVTKTRTAIPIAGNLWRSWRSTTLLPMDNATLDDLENELGDSTSGPAATAKAYFVAAEEDCKQGRFLDMAVACTKSIKAFPTVSAYENLGIAQYRLSDLDAAEKAMTQGLGLATRVDKEKHRSRLFLKLGWITLAQGKPPIARGYFESALTLFVDNKDVAGQATAKAGLGVVFTALGDYPAAERELRISLELLHSEEFAFMRCHVIGFLGDLYLRKNEKKDDALAKYEEALNVCRISNNRLGVANMLGSIGIAYGYKEEYGRALAMFQEARKEHQLYKDWLGEASDLSNIAALLRDQGKWEEATKFANDALERHQSLRNREGVALDLTTLGSIDFFRGNNSAAIPKLEEAVKIYEEMGVEYREKEYALVVLGFARQKKAK